MKNISVLLLICALAISVKLSAKSEFAAAYQQCGGTDYDGPTECVESYTCTVINDDYYQCLPVSESAISAKAKKKTTNKKTSNVIAGRKG